jgi:serine/threonine protein phosphatase 1
VSTEIDGREYAIGDVHGCLRALDTLLDEIAPAQSDTLVFLGDYVDRGPDSSGVIDRLIHLQRSCNAVFIKGNHEEMMLRARSDLRVWRMWMANGGTETTRSYGQSGYPDNVPNEHWEFLESSIDWHETDAHIFVHAPIRSDRPVAEQSIRDLRWTFEIPSTPHLSGKTVVCGHLAQESGRPVIAGSTILIDTWAYGGGWLTALDLGSRDAIQAGQSGDRRRVPGGELARDAGQGRGTA